VRYGHWARVGCWHESLGALREVLLDLANLNCDSRGQSEPGPSPAVWVAAVLVYCSVVIQRAVGAEGIFHLGVDLIGQCLAGFGTELAVAQPCVVGPC